jgi:hypothetical protein
MCSCGAGGETHAQGVPYMTMRLVSGEGLYIESVRENGKPRQGLSWAAILQLAIRVQVHTDAPFFSWAPRLGGSLADIRGVAGEGVPPEWLERAVTQLLGTLGRSTFR